MIGLLIGFTNIFFLHHDYPYINELITFLLAACCIVLNHFKHYTFSTYLFLFSLNFSIFYVNEYYDMSTAAYLFYFPVILCVALLHNPIRGLKHTLIFFTISFLFMGFSIFGEFDFIRSPHISDHKNQLLFSYNLSIAIVVSALMVVLVIQVIDRQNFQLMRALKKEKFNQEKISQALKEKEVMLSELHHRVKNNLSVISSLLNLQMNSTENEEAKKLLTESRNRVASMSLVHEKLYRKKDFSKIAFEAYLRELVNELIRASSLKEKTTINFSLVPCELDISVAIPVGLVVNEIITNSIKHAFGQLAITPVINVSMTVENNQTRLEISDNGKGFDYENRKQNSTSLGLTLIESLVEQVDGRVVYKNHGGSVYTLVF